MGPLNTSGLQKIVSFSISKSLETALMRSKDLLAMARQKAVELTTIWKDKTSRLR